MILSDDNLSLSGRYRDAYLRKVPCNMEAIILSRLGKFCQIIQENVQWNFGKWWERVRLTSRPVASWVLIPKASFHKAGEFLCFCHPDVPCGNPGPGCCSGLIPPPDSPSESLLIMVTGNWKTKARHLLFISQCVFFNRQMFLRAEGIYTAFLCLQHTTNTGIYISKEVCWWFFFFPLLVVGAQTQGLVHVRQALCPQTKPFYDIVCTCHMLDFEFGSWAPKWVSLQELTGW